MSDHISREHQQTQAQNAGFRPQASLGLDFGAYSSKISLAFQRHGGRTELHRVTVPRTGQMNSAGLGIFEHPALAALEKNGKLSVGKQAAKSDLTVPLKAMFLYLAGIRRRSTLEELPGSDELLEAIKQGRLTGETMTQALRAHFEWLRDAAAQTAAGHSCDIQALAFTYPNYLCGDEKSDDLDKYITYYHKWIDEIWPDVPHRFEVSEGQAAASYVSDDFYDPVEGTNAAARHKLFEGMSTENGLHLLVADWGSSSLNLQVVNLYFNEAGRLSHSQTSHGAGWLSGTRGGSHVANSRVLKIVKRKLASLIRVEKISPGEIAAYLQDFERQKQDLHYEECIRNGELMTLHGLSCPNLVIEPERLCGVFFDAFGAGERALASEIHRLGALGRDFGILFMGGSSNSPGLRDKIDSRVSEARATAGPGVNIRHAFLADQEAHPMSAVSAGAAISVINMPHPLSALGQSAIGIQTVLHKTRGMSFADDEASFMFARGCGELPPVLTSKSFYLNRAVEFSLVCDPNYRLQGVARPPLAIGKAGQVLNGPPSTYDLNWAVGGHQIPPGQVQMVMGGPHIERLAVGQGELPSLNDRLKGIPFYIKCYQINLRGNQTKNRRDSKFCLKLHADCVSKSLIVKEVCVVRLWCSICSEELKDKAFVCKSCRKTVCLACFVNSLKHDPKLHKVTRVNIDEGTLENC